MTAYRLGEWGVVVRPPPDEPGLTAIRIESGDAGGLMVLLRAGERSFDVWLETPAELQAWLAEMQINWSGPEGVL